MATSTECTGNRNGVEPRTCPQADLDARPLFFQAPQHGERGALFEEFFANGRLQHVGCIGYAAGGSKHRDVAGVLRERSGQLDGLGVHGFAARHEFGELVLGHVHDAGPAVKVVGAHVKRREVRRRIGVQPLEQIAVFHVLDEGRQFLAAVEILPRHAGATLREVEGDFTATAGQTMQIVAGALVVVEYNQRSGFLRGALHLCAAECNVEHVDLLAGQVGQGLGVRHGNVIPTAFEVEPGAQSGGEAIWALAVVNHGGPRNVLPRGWVAAHQVGGGGTEGKGQGGGLRHAPILPRCGRARNAQITRRPSGRAHPLRGPGKAR